jgi:hypothetical protein
MQSRQQDGEVTGNYFDEINIHKKAHTVIKIKAVG